MAEDILISVLCAVALVVGLIGTLIPILPGIAFMWVAALLYGFFVGFNPAGVVVMVLLTILAGASVVAGFVIPKKAADDSGARARSQIFGVVCAVIGFFVIPVVGAVVGALGGILLAEYLDKGELEPAWAATVGTAKGFGVGALIQFSFGFAMLLIWSIWAATVIF